MLHGIRFRFAAPAPLATVNIEKTESVMPEACLVDEVVGNLVDKKATAPRLYP